MRKEHKDIGHLAVEILEAFARVEEGEISFERLPGELPCFKNSAGLNIPHYTDLIQEFRSEMKQHRNLLLPTIKGMVPITAYLLANPIRTYKGYKRLYTERQKLK